jgi:hypothetical protein
MKIYVFQLLVVFLAVIALFAFSFSSNAQAQTPTAIADTPTIIPTITPNPTVVALQNVVATQQVDIQALQRDLKYELRDMRWWFLVAGVIFTIIGFFGYQTYKSIDEQIRIRIRRIISKYLYQLDLTNLEVYISKRLSEGDYKGHNLSGILKAQGIELKWFDAKPTKRSLQSITILPIENAEDEKAFVNYIENNKHQLNPQKAGFILYASFGHRLNSDTLNVYPTIVIANTAWNLASILMVMGRTLTPPPKYDELDD